MCGNILFFVMMNDTTKGFFKSERELWQGDPFSPYLFILIEDVYLVYSRSNLKEEGLENFYHPMGCLTISHLLYLDDILVFTNGERRSLKQLLKIIGLYEGWSVKRLTQQSRPYCFHLK